MSIELTTPELTELQPRITVMGVGGAGGNAVNNMIKSELQGVSFIVANTDAQALANSLCESRIQLGVESTRGLGAGSKPEVGEEAAKEALSVIEQQLDGCHMLFLAAGMGGGTGTGAAPVIARAARERGILTVGVVTKPFSFEGGRRMRFADAGITELQQNVDTLIVIPNQNLFRIATEKTTFQDAFAMADEVLNSGVRGITDLMVMPGLINLDFADVRTVMSEMGKAMMGTGEADGERRAIDAAEAAISNPLLDEVSLKGAKGVIINITGGMDLTLFEVDEAAKHIRGQVDEDANIIVGSAFNEALNGQIRVSVVATGIEETAASQSGGEGASVLSFAKPMRQTSDVETGGVSDNVPSEPQTSYISAQDDDAIQSAEAQESEAVAPADADTDLVGAVDVETAEDGEEELLLETLANEETNERDAKEAALAAAHNEDVFVAPEPKLPAGSVDLKSQPDVFAEAAFENATGKAETDPVPNETESAEDGQTDRGMSLFRRMATLGGRTNAASAQRQKEEPSAEKAGEANKEDRKLGRLNPEDRPVPSSKSEDQLEIPAFLRRQVN